VIHLGIHDHLMAEGHYKKIKQGKSLVEEEVSHTPWGTLSVIALVASKTFLSEHLLNGRWNLQMEVLKGDKLC
jgi:hypothetical protein